MVRYYAYCRVLCCDANCFSGMIPSQTSSLFVTYISMKKYGVKAQDNIIHGADWRCQFISVLRAHLLQKQV